MALPAELRFTRRFARRAALRALLAGAGARAVLAVVARAGGRRPPFAVGIAAAAGVGASLELPLAAPMAAVAVFVTARRARRPVLETAAVASAAAAAALFTTRWWPVPPQQAAPLTSRSRVGMEPAPRGDGVAIVVNADAGPALSRDPADVLREMLPDATVTEVEEGTELVPVLEAAVRDARALGVAGGDGTVNAGAAAVIDHGKPLMVVPAGTLNHLARDLGLLNVDDAIAAVEKGETIAMDVGEIDGRVFVNTASVGSYVALVDAREQLEERLGKWPAMLVALVRVVRRDAPVTVELNGRRRRLWMIFVGNCQYHPAGFAPSWRERLDDGQLDVRVLDAARRFARLRLVLAIVTGTLPRSRVYESFRTDRFTVRSLDGPLRLARDGETFDGSEEFAVGKRLGALAVYVPYD